MLRVLVLGRHYWSGLLRQRISLCGCGVGGVGAHIQPALKGCISTSHPAAQGLGITPSAGLNHVTVLHHYCTMLR